MLSCVPASKFRVDAPRPRGRRYSPVPEAAVTDRLLNIGIVGAVLTALCCFTPVLLLLGAVGLSALAGWLDYVMLPALAVFAGLIIYALLRRRRIS